MATSLMRRRCLVNLFVKSINQKTFESELTKITLRKACYGTVASIKVFPQYNFGHTSNRFYSVKSAQQEVDDFHQEHKVTIIGKDIPKPYINLENCEFPPYIKDYLKNQNFEKPTVIQSQGWPIALSGKNFVGIAQTGTGKTLAYLIPAIVHIKENNTRKGKGPVALILAPTRELARQIEGVANEFRRSLGIRCTCIYGGANRSRQAEFLERGVDIIIATPGRLNDFIETRTTSLARCTYVVLDEADRMLDMGFEPQIRMIMEGVPLERQVLMFSATWPKEVQHLAKDYLGEFVQVNVGSTDLSANRNIEQIVHFCGEDQKMEKLKSVMHQISGDGYGKILVFANTKRQVDSLTMALQRNGWFAVGIHGDKTQMQRDIVIKKFKTGQSKILVATDVAARGLDVDGITHVINFDFPSNAEDYIHRIGRTGRSQNKGQSHSILTADNDRQAKSLIDILKEAKQEVPQELYDMAKNFSIYKKEEKMEKSFSKRPFQKRSWNMNRRWVKERSYDKY